MIVEAGLGEFDFMVAIGIDNVFQMYDMIFGVYVDRNVALLNATAEGFDNVASCTDENSGVIPAREYLCQDPSNGFSAESESSDWSSWCRE